MNKIDLGNFTTYILTTGEPSVSITKNGVTFNKAAIIKLEKPEFVRVLFDYEHKLMVIIGSEKDEEGATLFLSPTKKVISVRWNNQDLLNSICEMMDWKISEFTYRVNAQHDKDQNLLLFNFADAKLNNNEK